MTNGRSVVLAIEDELSETVLRRLLAASGRGFEVDRVVMARGFGRIKVKMEMFATASRAVPHIVLTDLDRHACVSPESRLANPRSSAPAIVPCRGTRGGIVASFR